jgi:hypothetical protein
MNTTQKKRDDDQHDAAKEVIAALLAADLDGISAKEVRCRIEKVITGDIAKDRELVEKVVQDIEKLTSDPEVRRLVLRWAGKWSTLLRWLNRRGRGLFKKPEPGQRMLAIASLLFSKKKVERVFAPLVADYLHELAEVRADGWLKVAGVKVAWWYRFGKACGLDVVLALAGKIIAACLGL